MSSALKLKYSGYTHVGMKRAQNQDHFQCVPDIATFIVCDGMGGHKGGETASLLAVTAVCDSIRAAKTAAKWDAATAMQRAILEANNAVHEHAKKHIELQGMGTTCTALLFEGNEVFIGHVGDSRCYMLQPRKIWQLTRDHSLVQEKLRAGLITRDQLKTDRMKNVITRSVGFESAVEIDIYRMKIHAGDTFLICSDGLSGMCDDLEISEIISQSVFEKGNIDIAAQKLCEAANQHGGDDNVTSVIVSVF